jgi:flagellar secretion chaperone FliS
MWNDAHDRYLEERVLSAGPMELVRLLYEGCVAAVLDARRQLAEGDIAARSRAISRACDIVIELASALDRERGGEVAANLARMYDYILGRLMEANLKADDGILAEAARLLMTMSEAWGDDRAEVAPEPYVPVENAWGQPRIEEPELVGASHAWSF